MIVVLPVCEKDEEAALRNLAWAASLDKGPVPFRCLVSHEATFDASKVVALAKTYFAEVEEYRYPQHRGPAAWPHPQNWAWRQAAARIHCTERQSWLWWEQDAVPLRAGWLTAISQQYDSARKPYLGAESSTEHGKHLNGVAVYPADALVRVPEMGFATAAPFDVVGAGKVFSQAEISPLIQHVWTLGEKTNSAPAPTFTRESDLAIIRPETALFHRCKDDSLIKLIRKKPFKLRKLVASILPAPPAPGTNEPPCLIMLGGLGDVLNVMPVAYHYSRTCKTRVPFMTSSRFATVFDGASYIQPVGQEGTDWQSYTTAIAWAQSRYKKVYPLHLGEPGVIENHQSLNFCIEQYKMAGLDPGLRGTIPLVFDRRNSHREATLYKRLDNGKPILLYNLTGHTSPCEHSGHLLKELRREWGEKLNLVDTSAFQLTHFHDLLGLFERAVGMVSIDTATLHLAPACDMPYVALSPDQRVPWWSTVPLGNCVLHLGYTHVRDKTWKILDTVGQMVDAKAGKIAAVKSDRRPRLVTLATGESAKVWQFARESWAHYCRKNGYELVEYFKPLSRDLHPSWNKPLIIYQELEKSGGPVWWIDADTVCDGTMPLDFTTEKDILTARNWNGICMAMLRCANTPWAKKFMSLLPLLGDVRNSDKYGKGCGIKWEENAVKGLMQEFPEIEKHMGFLPDNVFYDYPTKSVPRRALPKDVLAFHFGARSNATRIEQMRTFKSL